MQRSTRVFSVRRVLPFVVPGYRDQAPGVLERFAEERLRSDCLDAGVERGEAQFLRRFVPPIGHQSPTHLYQLAAAATTVSAGSVGLTLKLGCILGIAAGTVRGQNLDLLPRVILGEAPAHARIIEAHSGVSDVIPLERKIQML